MLQQHYALNRADTGQERRLTSTSNVSMKKKSDLAWLLVPEGLVEVFQKLLNSWDFHAQQEFTQVNGEKSKKHTNKKKNIQ